MTVLTQDLLERIRSRLAGYVRDNSFFTEDLDDHGASWFRKLMGELARLQRDVLAGLYHPSNSEAVHSTVAANLLGALE